MIPRITPADSNIPRWQRSAAATVNLLCTGQEAAETRLATAEGDITALDGRVTTAEGGITALEGDVTALDGRVTVLEAPEIIKLTPLAADPSSPAEGWLYANSTTHKLRYYDGTVWNDLF
jgi:hypothetical protein